MNHVGIRLGRRGGEEGGGEGGRRRRGGGEVGGGGGFEEGMGDGGWEEVGGEEEGRREGGEGHSHESWSLSMVRVSLCYSIGTSREEQIFFGRVGAGSLGGFGGIARLLLRRRSCSERALWGRKSVLFRERSQQHVRRIGADRSEGTESGEQHTRFARL